MIFAREPLALQRVGKELLLLAREWAEEWGKGSWEYMYCVACISPCRTPKTGQMIYSQSISAFETFLPHFPSLPQRLQNSPPKSSQPR